MSEGAHRTSFRAWLADVIETKLPYLFLLYALPCVVLLSIIMAPFQVADELAHVQRSDQISRGKAISDRLGGTIDGGWVVFGALYQNMWFHPEVKQTAALARQAGAIRWSGPKDHVNFQNTAQYGPALYLPQVIGILFGRLTGLSLARTLVIVRLVNGLAAGLVGFLALCMCRRGRALMFATLLLPMTLSQCGSASPDALLISLSILAVALVSHVLVERRPASTGEFALFALIVTATTMARPSQLALALLGPALCSRQDAAWKPKALIATVAVATVVTWMRILAGLVPPLAPELSPAGQTQLLLANPLLLPTLIVNTLAMQGIWLMKTVVGGLGWVDTLMPNWYYLVAAIALGAALIAPGNRRPLLRPAALGLFTIAALFTVLCAALYVSWTPLGQSTINGMQGRYILPVLPLLAWVMPEYRLRLEQPLAFAWWLVMLFPLVTLAVTPVVIMGRYYGSWGVMAASLKALLLP